MYGVNLLTLILITSIQYLLFIFLHTKRAPWL
nr:MAG TPA: hypothetical protein [Caudoviricetes sp.]DAU75063.1 MAG TPA: hypothetical protein [Caudoviricetes sp.]